MHSKKNIKIAVLILFIQLCFALLQLCTLLAKASIMSEPISKQTKDEQVELNNDNIESSYPSNTQQNALYYKDLELLSEINVIYTPTPTSTPSPTPSPTNTVTPVPTCTNTPIPTPTNIPTPVPITRSENSVSESGRYYVYQGTITDTDIRDMAALLYLEAGNQSTECKNAIVSVMINLAVRENLSIHSTIFNTNRFSPANRISSTTPSQECLNVVTDIVANGTTVPVNVLAFRNRHYHNFGTPYKKIDAVYFSTL